MKGPQDATEAAAQVQDEEASLSPAQKAELVKLQKQKQKMDEKKNGRRLMQGPKTQSSVQTIAEMNEVDGAKPYPYDSWTDVNGKQTASEAAAQVQEEEAALSPSQKAKLAALQKQKQDEAKKGKN